MATIMHGNRNVLLPLNTGFPIVPSPVGSRWKVIWEEADLRTGTPLHSAGNSRDTSTPMYLTFTRTKFKTDDGFEGLWTWELHPGGRLVIHINDAHPPGWACLTGETQDEFILCFSSSPYAPSRERMRWIRIK